MKTEVVSASENEAVRRAVDLLRVGEVVALPTETVYGLAADAFSEKAVLRIFETKARPRYDPLIVHLPSEEWAEQLVKVEKPVRARFASLVKQFWPGPLTFIFTRQSGVPDIVTAGLETVAIRRSSHPVFTQIIETLGRPLAAPSANRFGRISPTTAAHVVEELGGLIPLVVDAGPTAHGLESTIVALRNERIEVLRRGPVTEEQLAEFGEVVVGAVQSRIEAPGQLRSHYAPRTPLQVVEVATAFDLPPNKRCGLLSWRSGAHGRFAEVRVLSARQDLQEAATNLFRLLRELDACSLDLIVAEKLPNEGLGAAINDRLGRAAAR